MPNIALSNAPAYPSPPTLRAANLAVEPYGVAPVPNAQDHQVTEIKEIITSFKHLLSEHPDSAAGKGIRREIFVLERWLSSFRRGLISAAKLAANGPAWLNLHRGKLVHASEEALLPEPSQNIARPSDPMLLTRDPQDKTWVGATQTYAPHDANRSARLDMN